MISEITLSLTLLHWWWPVIHRYNGAFAIRMGPAHFYVRYRRQELSK